MEMKKESDGNNYNNDDKKNHRKIGGTTIEATFSSNFQC